MGIGLARFKGNRMSKTEKAYRLKQLANNDNIGEVDRAMMPFLNRMNQYGVCSTQCCSGHYENPNKMYRRRNGRLTSGRRAHIDFRSVYSVDYTVDHILRPFETKYGSNIWMATECNRLRYCIWLDNKGWKGQMEYLVRLIRKAHKDYGKRRK